MSITTRRLVARAVVGAAGLFGVGSLIAWAVTGDDALLWAIAIAGIGLVVGALMSPAPPRPRRRRRLDAWRSGHGTSEGGGNPNTPGEAEGGGGGGCGGGCGGGG